ncbi:MAG: hypothetical protein PHE17_19550 [Thiothrix sp.]|uniref:hypothetical protein n=1 Tax=Thiothrix sp. TaxID=1032 RepID=UPI00262BD76B|nr:hypothetical protein [Thiothrix sp.]MDD5395224.1 hypothetical protein [Thiothrix sp.]
MNAIALAYALTLYPAANYKHEVHCEPDNTCQDFVTDKKTDIFEMLLKLKVENGKATKI